jgi:lipopolysaccharide/colanic/teichoic acid biosynthesis glycosyltransferase
MFELRALGSWDQEARALLGIDETFAGSDAAGPFNVIKNDTSVVEPRPERPYFHTQFEKFVPGFSQRLKVKSGIAGLAQVNDGYKLPSAEKVSYDIEYMKNMSVSLDMKIILKTFAVVFKSDGAR